jgi:RNA polymerase sigma factor (sigma-70 family)
MRIVLILWIVSVQGQGLVIAGWYQEHQPWLQKWLLRRLPCSGLAADLTQDTFVRLLVSWRDKIPDAISEPRAYLASVAKCVLIDHYRRASLEQAYLQALQCLPEAYHPSPETQAILLASLIEIDTMLDGLPLKVRSAFLLVQIDGLSYAEVARELQVSISSVQKYMAKATEACLLYRLAHAE